MFTHYPDPNIDERNLPRSTTYKQEEIKTIDDRQIISNIKVSNNSNNVINNRKSLLYSLASGTNPNIKGNTNLTESDRTRSYSNNTGKVFPKSVTSVTSTIPNNDKDRPIVNNQKLSHPVYNPYKDIESVNEKLLETQKSFISQSQEESRRIISDQERLYNKMNREKELSGVNINVTNPKRVSFNLSENNLSSNSSVIRNNNDVPKISNVGVYTIKFKFK
jgi:hypothetical protein